MSVVLPVSARMKKIRVMIVDDSGIIRRMLARAFESDPLFEVVGQASSAEMALERIPQLKPDAITLDIHMSGISGLELLPKLRHEFPRLKVLVFSTLTQREAEECFDALTQVGTDYLTKPALDETAQAVLNEVCRRVQMLCARRVPIAPKPFLVAPRTEIAMKREVLAIGVSTGGPVALTQLISNMMKNFPLPIVIVQHMPPMFTKLLANRIQTLTGFNIVEAEDGMLLEPGKAFLAPGDFHMRLVNSASGVKVKLDQGPQECSCRPAVDVLFRSVHEVFGGRAIAAVMTGMGQDGLRGVELLSRAGAHVIAQDEATSVVWGMPGAIVNAGLANEVLDLGSIANAIQMQVRMGRDAKESSGNAMRYDR